MMDTKELQANIPFNMGTAKTTKSTNLLYKISSKDDNHLMNVTFEVTNTAVLSKLIVVDKTDYTKPVGELDLILPLTISEFDELGTEPRQELKEFIKSILIEYTENKALDEYYDLWFTAFIELKKLLNKRNLDNDASAGKYKFDGNEEEDLDN